MATCNLRANGEEMKTRTALVVYAVSLVVYRVANPNDSNLWPVVLITLIIVVVFGKSRQSKKEEKQ